MALSRSITSRTRREHRHAGRGLYAARARVAAWRATRIRRAVHKGRGAEPDSEFQSARHGGGSLDGPRDGREEAGGTLGGPRRGRARGVRAGGAEVGGALHASLYAAR